MNALALGLYLLFYSHPYVDETPQLPPLSDRVKFPDRYTAGVQLEQWRIHIDRLEYLRLYNPGLPHLWLAEAKRNARYYELLLLAHDSNFSATFHRERLNDLLLLVGPAAYLSGWRPVELLPGKVLPSPVAPRTSTAEAI